MAEPATGDQFNFGQGNAFGSSAPEPTMRGARDEHFIQADDKSGDSGMWKKGENAFLVLPPFSNYIGRYQQIQAAAEAVGKVPEWPIGHIYYRLNVRTKQASTPRAYRVPRDNEYHEVFRKLYQGMCGGQGPWSDALKKIASHLVGGNKHGFQPDCRFVLNILLSEHLSAIKWFDAPLDEGELDEERDKRVGTRIRMLFGQYWQYTPQRLPLFDLDNCVPLTMNVSITWTRRGNRERPLPNWGDVKPMFEPDQRLKVVNARNLLTTNVQGYQEEMLDELEKWATGFDELPDLNDIPNLKKNGEACEILGLARDEADSPGAVHSVAAASAPQAAPAPTPAPAQGAPVAPAPAGGGAFGAAASVASAPAAPVAAPAPQAAPASGVGGAFSTFDQNGAKAAADFKASVEAGTGQPPAAPPAAPPAYEEGEPPF